MKPGKLYLPLRGPLLKISQLHYRAKDSDGDKQPISNLLWISTLETQHSDSLSPGGGQYEDAYPKTYLLQQYSTKIKDEQEVE